MIKKFDKQWVFLKITFHNLNLQKKYYIFLFVDCDYSIITSLYRTSVWWSWRKKKFILKEYLDKFNNPLCLFPERKQFENKYCKVQKYLIFSWYAENDYVWNSNVLVKKYFDFCKRELFLLCRYPLICFSNVWRNIIWNV